MTEAQLAHVTRTWAIVDTIKDTAAAMFYKRLFEIDSTAEPLFARVKRESDMKSQGRLLMKMIGDCVALLHDTPALIALLKRSGARHVKFGIKDPHYDSVGAALLWTLEQGLGKEWTPEVAASWKVVYGVIADNMKEGAREFIAAEKAKREGPKGPSPLIVVGVLAAAVALFFVITKSQSAAK